MQKKTLKLDYTGAKVYTGRQMFDASCVSTLNKKSVNILTTAVLACYEKQEGISLTPALADTLNHLLVDGSMIVYNSGIVEAEIEYITTTEAVFESAKEVYTHVVVGEEFATLTQYGAFDHNKITAGDVLTGLSAPLDEPPLQILASSIILFPNGNGILYDYQRTLLRIEEIYYTLGKTTPLSALIFMSNMSLNADKLNASIAEKVQADKPVVPIPAGSTGWQPDFSDLGARLNNELALLEPNFMEATFAYKTFPNESGVARRYQMQRFVSKVNEMKGQCIDIYKRLGYDISFTNTDISEADEDQKDLDNLYAAVDRGILTNDQIAQRVMKILNIV